MDVYVFNVFCILYHLFATVPVVLQSVVQLVRTTMALTAKVRRWAEPLSHHEPTTPPP